MCGRFTLHHSVPELVSRFSVEQTFLDLPPRYNIAPSQPVAVVIQRQQRQLLEFRWGLVPFWAKAAAIGNRLINARAESLPDTAAFRNAFRRRRCIVPASGYFEWMRRGSGKVPHYIQLADRQPFAMAGLSEKWQAPNGEVLRTCAIVTTEPSPAVAGLHHRMPAILTPEAAEIWLEPETGELPALLSLLRPYPGELSLHPVSPLVNRADVDEAACVQPVDAPDLQLGLDL